jgi:type I restriction enzyme, S subunit
MVCIGTIGKCNVIERDCSFNQQINSATLYEGLPRYLLVVARSGYFQAKAWSESSRTTIAILNKGNWEAIPIPLPSIAEQHRIVAKVDELMALCDRLEAQQADAESAHAQLVATLLDSLTQASDSDDFAVSWQRLSAHFHTLFTTGSSIDALKQTLLQLAVMGKLVPQDSNDEPTSELIKRMQAERRRLVAEKAIRQGKPLSEVEHDEMPFDLPKNWVVVKLGQIGDWGAGATPARGNQSYYGGATPWFKSGELIADFVSESEETVTELALKECSLRRNKIGDVLIAMYGATIGKTAILAVPATTNQAVCACTPFGGLFNRYLLLTLKAMKPNFIGQGAGGAQPNISREKIISTVVGLPPEAEQHRIVVKVDQLMALCDKLNTAIRRRDQHSRHLADALVDKALSPVSETSMNVVDLSCYLVDRLVVKPTFGRTTHMKLIYLAETHLGFDFRGEYMREAAGPLDRNIYQVEKQAQANGWYTHTSAPLKSGVEKVTYHATDTLAAKARQVAEALGDRRQDLDRLIALFGDKKTDEVQIVATLFAAWNDALLDGQSPGDDWIIREVRENWHAEKQRFTAEKLGHWLDWMRKHHLVPTGKPPRTQQQVKMFQ